MLAYWPDGPLRPQPSDQLYHTYGPDVDARWIPLPAEVDTFSTQRVLLATDRVGAHAKALGYADAEAAAAAITATYTGSQLVGLVYEPLFTYFVDAETYGTENAFRILADDYVSTEDGTGLVHQAPAYGEEDHGSMKLTVSP